jgi:chemotaxis protein methyltransferase CheR
VEEQVDGLAAFMGSRYGLVIGESARANLATALAMAAAGRGLHPSACLELAQRGDEQLLQTFVHAVTIHETYFFRHPQQFDLLRAIAREQLRERPRPLIRALSAGCASGEEAYSIAVALRSATEGLSSPPRIEVLGIDIDGPSLEKAEAARYGGWSIRDPLPGWADGCILGAVKEGGEVAQPYRAMVRFRRVNLHDSFLALLLANDAPFDFIFCRNVLMYLLPTSATRVARHLINLLAPNGYLTFSPVDLDRIPKMLGRRPDDPTFLSRAADVDGSTSRPDEIAAALPERSAASRQDSSPAPAPASSRHLGEMLAEAKRLVDSGELTRAKGICAELLRRHSDVPAALFLAAMVEMESGAAFPAERLLLGALDRQPDFALAHFALSTILKRQGRTSEARARLVRLSHLLAGIPAETVLAGPEEITCGWLRSLVNDHLNA